MRIIDESGATIESPDLEAGHLDPDKVLVTHHDALPKLDRIEVDDPENVIEEILDENGEAFGLVIAKKIVQEYRPAKEAWDEYEDVMRYILYTPGELAAIAERRAAAEAARTEAERLARELAEKAAEREAFLEAAPERLDTIESIQLDTDEAVASIYEGMTQSQLDTDEALVTIYETLGGTK